MGNVGRHAGTCSRFQVQGPPIQDEADAPFQNDHDLLLSMVVQREDRLRPEAVLDNRELHEVYPTGLHSGVGVLRLDRAEVDDRPVTGTSARTCDLRRNPQGPQHGMIGGNRPAHAHGALRPSLHGVPHTRRNDDGTPGVDGEPHAGIEVMDPPRSG